ncbi:hypothetical protein [Methanobrevibacter olleyae]|uniref:Uncharacterized protein n=1 Tax=Methanobrevibacter olleyae TaxID=294671 RepID=A0A126R075_METOL|nr:hypothetical protein [Methanobrevibacter olleyae]AMK15783.1 hypothetical protein YLM1_1226 [Methanobrevibacter olleyae]SFL19115.1 hypothetical protein SAMN02910297_00151 [Methanobrevibacter olleyae]
MGCFNETTSVKINKEKKDLAKSKGLKLQDLLDHALDEALGLGFTPLSELRIMEIDNEIESLKIQKEKAMGDCQRKIDILVSGLMEFKEAEEAEYDRKIRQLELEKEYNKQMLYKN